MMRAVSFCPSCLRRSTLVEVGGAADIAHLCGHCGERWYCEYRVACPSPRCGNQFTFQGQLSCPLCGQQLADGVPLRPALLRSHFLDRIIPVRRAAFRAQRQRAECEFEAIRDSWARDAMGVETCL